MLYQEVTIPAIKVTPSGCDLVDVVVSGYVVDGIVVYKSGSRYSLVHIASGIEISSRRISQLKAKQWASQCASLLDWKQSADLLYTPANLPKLHQVVSMPL